MSTFQVIQAEETPSEDNVLALTSTFGQHF